MKKPFKILLVLASLLVFGAVIVVYLKGQQSNRIDPFSYSGFGGCATCPKSSYNGKSDCGCGCGGKCKDS